MRKLALSLCFVGTSFLYGQVQSPQPSPAAQLMQTIGLTEVSISYSRPSAKGREVIGNLVPFGQVWRTGANKNTTIHFSDPVVIEGKKLSAGTYAIYSKPSASSWEVYFYTDTENWGLPEKWDPAKVAAAVQVIPATTSPLESFSIWISDLTHNDGVLNIGWENTMLALKIEVPTHEKAMASIEKTLANNPKERDYYSSAVYYLQSGQDLQQAKEWIHKAIEMNDKPYWYFRQQSLILAALKDTKAAIEAAKKSLSRAQEAGNMDYVKMNTESIAEWSQ